MKRRGSRAVVFALTIVAWSLGTTARADDEPDMEKLRSAIRDSREREA